MSRPISELERTRRAAGISLSELAVAVGVSVSYASRVERGLVPASARFKAGAVAVLSDHLEAALFGEERPDGP